MQEIDELDDYSDHYEEFILDDDPPEDDFETLQAHLLDLRSQSASLKLDIERQDFLLAIRHDPSFALLDDPEATVLQLARDWQRLKEETRRLRAEVASGDLEAEFAEYLYPEEEEYETMSLMGAGSM
jgi:ribosomal protein L29